MTDSTPSESARRAAELAARLLGMRAELHGETAEVRLRRLAAQVERDAAGLPGAARAEVLGAMAGQLADVREALGRIVGFMPSAAPMASDDPGGLVERLGRVLPTLEPARRAVIENQLRDVLAPVASRPGTQGDFDAASLGKALGVDGSEIDADRAIEAFGLLVEFAAAIDLIVWNTWRVIAPESRLKRGATVKSLVGGYLSHSPADAPSPRAEIERLRLLTAGLTAAIGQAGRQFAQAHAERYAPGEIERAVREEGKVNIEARAWQRYQQLAASLDPETVQRDLSVALASFVESILKSVGSTR